MINLDDFLAAFFQNLDEKIYIRALPVKDVKKTAGNSPTKLVITRRELSGNEEFKNTLKQYNKNRGIYFVVNAGGHTDREIKRFNAFFVENDIISIETQHKRLDNAPLLPSIRVVTKKSVHAYWLIENPLEWTEENAKKWREVQEILILYFGGDPAIKNPSRLMRLPFFNHLQFNNKTLLYESKEVLLHTIEPDRRYTLEEMHTAFAGVKNKNTTVSDEDNKDWVTETAQDKKIKKIFDGERSNTLISLAGTMRKRGMTEQAITAALLEENKNRCIPSLEEKEVLTIAKSILRYKPGEESNYTSDTRQKEFHFTTLDDLLNEPEEDTPFIWENTLPAGGFSIVSAKPKVGKSTFGRNLALAVINGQEFLGRGTAKGSVLYLCLEEKRSEVKLHFAIMGAGGTDILIHTGPPPPNAITALAIAIAEVDPVLVIIDPLSRVLRVNDFNEYGSMTRGLEPLIDLARKTGTHIVALHHEGKTEREGGDALLGSTALYGSVDAHVQLRKRESTRTILTSQRYGVDLPETIIEMSEETGIITAKGKAEDLTIEKIKIEIVNAFGFNEQLSGKEIKERVKANSMGIISKALGELLENEVLLRVGMGAKGSPYIYSLAKAKQ